MNGKISCIGTTTQFQLNSLSDFPLSTVQYYVTYFVKLNIMKSCILR